MSIMKKFIFVVCLVAGSAVAGYSQIVPEGYKGDINAAQVINCKFTSNVAALGVSVPTALGGSPAVKAYKNNDTTTESTAGITFTGSFDSITGLNNVNVDTSADGTFYSAGSEFTLIITSGTLGGTSVAGSVLCGFSIADRYGSLSTGGSLLADLRKVNGGSTGSTAAVLELKRIAVVNDLNNQAAVRIRGTIADGPGLQISAGTAAPGLLIYGGNATASQIAGPAFQLIGGDANVGTLAAGAAAVLQSGYGDGITYAIAPAIVAITQSPSVYGADNYGFDTLTNQAVHMDSTLDVLTLDPTGTGKAINALGGLAVTPSSGPAVKIDASVADHYGVWIRGDSAVFIEGAGADGATALDIGTGQTGNAINIRSGAVGDYDSVHIEPSGTGKAINALGQVAVTATGKGVDAVLITPDTDQAGIAINGVGVSGSTGVNVATEDVALKFHSVASDAANFFSSRAGSAGLKIAGGDASGGNSAGPAVYLNGGYGSSGMNEYGAPALFMLGGYDPTHGSGPGFLAIADTESGDTAALDHVQIGVNSPWLQVIYPFISNAGPTNSVTLKSDGAGKGLVGSTLAIPKGVAYTNFTYKLVLASDNKSPITGAAGRTCKISKDGGAFADCANATSEIGLGWYTVTLSSTEMTADSIVVRFTATSANTTEFQLLTNP